MELNISSNTPDNQKNICIFNATKALAKELYLACMQEASLSNCVKNLITKPICFVAAQSIVNANIQNITKQNKSKEINIKVCATKQNIQGVVNTISSVDVDDYQIFKIQCEKFVQRYQQWITAQKNNDQVQM